MTFSLSTLSPIVGSLYLIENLTLLYIFLTPKRSFLFQATAFAVPTLLVLIVAFPPFSLNTELSITEKLLRDYLLGCLFLIPCVLVFKETLHVKIFIFFMNYSLTQLIYLIFMYLDRFLSPRIPHFYVMTGLLLELAALPLVYRYIRAPIKNIISILDRPYTVFTLFPLLSFVLLAFYGLQGNYVISSFITLVLSTLLIFITYYLISVSITASRRRQELEVISNSDSLTGIFNRRHMEQRIQEEFKRYCRTNLGFALVLMDIDFFKRINDKYGHDCGDDLLKEIAKDIVNLVRGNDIVARWGGEEFLLLLPATNGVHAAKLAERIRKATEERRYSYGPESISVTLTLGVSTARPEETLSTIVKRADIALYRGKNDGRNRVVLVDGIENHEV